MALETNLEPAMSTEPTPLLYLAVLPGPDRKRSRHLYHYRLTYRSPRPEECGCVAVWEVGGGGMSYQVALEREGGADVVRGGAGEGQPAPPLLALHLCRRSLPGRGRGPGVQARTGPAR